MARCSLCYRERGNQMTPIVPGSPAICKGCTMDVDRTLGFLSMHGYGLTRTMEDELHMINLVTGEVHRTTWESIQQAGAGMNLMVGDPAVDLTEPPANPPKAPPTDGKGAK